MRAVAYVRASTDKQEASIKQQKQAISVYCDLRACSLCQWFEDDGVSGTSSERPGFKRMLEMCEYDNAIDAVIVYDRSRFGRWLDHKDAVFWEQKLKHLGVSLVVLNGNNGNDIGANITQMIENHTASEYSRKLSSDVRRGARHNAERGYWNGGRSPYGYRRMLVDPATGEDMGILEPGERKGVKDWRVRLVLGPRKEQRTVKAIFEERAMDCSLREIAEYLNSIGWASPTGGNWSKQQVSNILRNPVYTGSIQWSDKGGKYEGSGEITSKQAAHEAIIGGESE